MRPALDDPAAFQHENLIRAQHGRKPMRDDEARPVRHQMLERFLDQPLGRGVHARRRFIENEDRRILEQRARDRQPLLFAHAQFHPALARPRCSSPLGRRSMNGARIRRLGRAQELLVGRLRISHEQVVAHRAVEEKTLLRDHARPFRADAAMPKSRIGLPSIRISPESYS